MQPLPGFRDFYPEDCAFRRWIIDSWRLWAHRYGFVEYDGPPLEPLELYKKKSGDELVGQLYHFVDKGDREVALRAEMTPTLARMVSARHRDFRKPLKWFSVPQVFRYERSQKGRLREHFQLNCDLIGEQGLDADIELISLCLDILRGLGLQADDIVVRLSDRQFWVDFLRAQSVPEDQWYMVFQAIDKSEREPEEKTRERLGALADPVLQVLRGGATSERLDYVMKGLAARGLAEFAQVDFRIVRGLAYYTGVVFEVFDRKGEFRAIAGGGRYDDLLEKLGQESLPAVGFGMGDVVLGELLKARGLAPKIKDHLQAFVVLAEEAHRLAASGIVQQLRQAGLSVDYPLAETKMKKQFESAEHRGARFIVIVDSKFAEGLVHLKELSTREQIEVPVTELLSTLQAKFKG